MIESLPDEIVNKIMLYIQTPCGKIMKDYLYEEEHYFLPAFLLLKRDNYYLQKYNPFIDPFIQKPPIPHEVEHLIDILTDTWWRIGSDGDESWELVDTFYDKIIYE